MLVRASHWRNIDVQAVEAVQKCEHACIRAHKHKRVHGWVRDARTHTHTHACTYVHTHTIYCIPLFSPARLRFELPRGQTDLA